MHTTSVVDVKRSSDGETLKLLIELQDGLRIESVIMFYDTSKRWPAETGQKAGIPPERRGNNAGRLRATLCVSSEVGCAMGCTFCATGTMSLTADLTGGEIVEQLVHALKYVPRDVLQGIVFMGMGEPLNNYISVKSAVKSFTHGTSFAFRHRKITVSTVGVIHRMKQLADDLPKVSLALSLHAPSQELRQKIVPSAKAYRLEKILAALEEYQQKTSNRVFIEYVFLGPAVNCLPEHAHQLGRLLEGRDVVINLIKWNPILSPAIPFGAPPQGAVQAFSRILKWEYGLPVTVRQEKGQDVSAACGQLVLEHGVRCHQSLIKDVEDLALSH